MYVSVILLLALTWPSVMCLPQIEEKTSDQGDSVVYDLYPIIEKRSSGGHRSGEPTETNSCSQIRKLPDDIREELSIPDFYQKYTEAYGIPVITSNLVPDAAIKRACYTLRFLFADWYVARRSYYKWKGKVGLIGRTEQITDIPEYSHLPDWWNQRARGFGATTASRISIGSEENALCRGPRTNYDLVLHEVAHGLEGLGLNFQDSDLDYEDVEDFPDRLWKTYKNAVDKGLWTDEYIGSNRFEYFAEGVVIYFNDHHPVKGVDSREKLKEYDPELYGLLQDVFKCNNEYIKRCEDTTQENALKQRLRINAPECKLEELPCEDQNKKCAKLAKKGKCSKNKVKDMCRKSCKQC